MAQTIGIEQLLNRHSVRHRFDFKVEVPCPMKNRFQEAFGAFAAEQVAATGNRYYSFVPSACGEHVDGTGTIRDIASATEIDQLPDVAIDFASGPFASPGIVKRFASEGLFEPLIDPGEVSFLSDPATFADPWGAFNLLAVNPEVMLVETKALAGRPAPATLEDLLDPMWAGSLCLPDNHGHIGTRFLTSILMRFGTDGLDAIERNAITAMNGPTIARSAGHGRPDAAVYLLPWVFARAAARPGRLELVWPEDGANCNPIILVAKRERDPKNNALVEFLLSEQIGRVFSENQFPATHSAVATGMPSQARVSWLGWDHVLSGAQVDLDAELISRFDRFHQDNSC